MSSNLTYRWSLSINEIPNCAWEKVFGNSIVKSRSFFQVMEDSNFAGVSYYYLQIYKCQDVLSIIPCFSYELDFLNLTTSSIIKELIKFVRKFSSNFFKVNAFVTGSYAASCEHFIEYASDILSEDKPRVIQLINQCLKNKSREIGTKFIFIKDIRERSINHVRHVLSSDFHFFVSFPTTAVPIFLDCTYPEALKKKNRKRYRNYTEIFNMHFEWETVTNFSGTYAHEFMMLYQNVLEKAKNKFEILNERFFCNINAEFPQNSFLLIAKSHEGEIRLMELVLEEQNKLIPLYLGIKYKTDDTRILYLNAIFKTIKEAENRNKILVDFGQTSYYPKVMSGALVENIYYGFWSEHFFLKWLINNVFQKIFLPPEIPEPVYLETCKHKALRLLEKEGFSLLNK